MTFDHLMHDPNTLSAICGLGAFSVVVLIWSAIVEHDPLSARLRNVAEFRGEVSKEERRRKKSSHRDSLMPKDLVKRLVQKMQLEKGKQLYDIRMKLARAGFRSHDAVLAYLLIRVIAPLAIGFVGFFAIFVLQLFNWAATTRLLALLGSFFIGMALPELYLKNISQKRLNILRKGMPDALDLFVICAEAGLSLDASLDRVSREVGPSNAVLAEEVGLTGVELSFFPDRAKALRNFGERVPLQGVIGLVNTLIQTEKYGTPLAQALRVLSTEMRNERMMAAEAKAAKLPAILTVPMILFILPPLFVVLLGPAILGVMAINSGQ